jgi:hypothetical protein
MRDYNALISAAINALPMREELAALSDEQIENLRNCGNTYDNWLYLELLKRRGEPVDPLSSKTK